jgi:hypothetical protein
MMDVFTSFLRANVQGERRLLPQAPELFNQPTIVPPKLTGLANDPLKGIGILFCYKYRR